MRKRLTWASGLILGALAFFVALGSIRYGGTDNLYRRIYVEVAARQPHPEYVPTPLPTSGAARPPTVVASVATAAAPGPALVASTIVLASHPLELSKPEPEIETSLPPEQTRKPTPAARPTQPPSATPRATPSPSPQPSVVPPTTLPLPPRVQLSGLTHIWQTWNNCGPATLAMNLSYYGREANQAIVAGVLRPNKEDKNVSPGELAAFARAQGLHAVARVNGDSDRLRRLLAAGVPVLIETWHEPAPNDGMGHYRLLTGYDDETQEWIAFDSYDGKGAESQGLYAGIRRPYEQLDQLWKVFNRQYIVVYSDELAPAVQQILGPDMDDVTMWQRALAGAEAAAAENPRDPFTWFNLGTDLVALGRYQQAAEDYDRARQIGLPWRMLWYQFGPFRAYYEMGRYDEVIALANATLRTAKYVEELCYWRGLAQHAQGNDSEARASFQQALDLNRNYALAAAALAALPAP